jgi:hypothetical protein
MQWLYRVSRAPRGIAHVAQVAQSRRSAHGSVIDAWFAKLAPRVACTSWQDDLRILRVRAIEEHHVAEYLRDLAAGALGDCLRGIVAFEARGFADLDLHQLVIVERLVDGCNEALIDPTLADLDGRLELMPESAKMTTLFAGQHGGL